MEKVLNGFGYVLHGMVQEWTLVRIVFLRYPKKSRINHCQKKRVAYISIEANDNSAKRLASLLNIKVD